MILDDRSRLWRWLRLTLLLFALCTLIGLYRFSTFYAQYRLEGQNEPIRKILVNEMTAAYSFFFLLPNILLSGFVFPISNMPKGLQLITLIIPARYLIDALRGVLLRGNGLAELWPDALALANRLTMPVYLAHGEQDALMPVGQARALADRLAGRPSFRYAEIGGGDHDSPLWLAQEALLWIVR